MTNIDKETQEKFQELQIAEQNLQNLLLQKQAFELELNELESALEELKKSGDEVYKIFGQIMVKSNKLDIIKELEEKNKILNLRIKTLENQEKITSEKIETSRKELEKKIKNNSK